MKLDNFFKQNEIGATRKSYNYCGSVCWLLIQSVHGANEIDNGGRKTKMSECIEEENEELLQPLNITGNSR